jgi:hypothetical protein
LQPGWEADSWRCYLGGASLCINISEVRTQHGVWTFKGLHVFTRGWMFRLHFWVLGNLATTLDNGSEQMPIAWWGLGWGPALHQNLGSPG